ncbi:hypothetical protein GWI34_14470 [Actinomadura sp. DSM 109109]|nr:hypothetical protein [Actinomadura lepetitiana]
MVLTEGQEQAHAFLRRQPVPGRVLITCDGDHDSLSASVDQGKVAVISLSSTTGATAGARDVETTANVVAPSGIDVLTPLSKDDAFNQLMSMPTIARPACQ